MKLQSISVAVKDANQSGVGKKFLKMSISLTVLLNLQSQFGFLWMIWVDSLLNEKFNNTINSILRDYLWCWIILDSLALLNK